MQSHIPYHRTLQMNFELRFEKSEDNKRTPVALE